MSDGRQPWDRAGEEPATWFARFLLYRSLGPQREVNEAYRLWTGEVPEGSAGCRKASGAWQRASRAFRWRERATAWDLHNLATAGREALAAFNETVARAARKLLGAVDGLAGPTDWKEFREALDAVGKYITPELLRRFQLGSDPGAAAGAAPEGERGRGERPA